VIVRATTVLDQQGSPSERPGDGSRPAPAGKPSTPCADGGRLHLVALPIGDPDDLTLRARRLLAEVDVIACEDTRETTKLLRRHGIDPGRRLVAYHDHNGATQRPVLLAALAAGRSVALVPDAGTPLVSDPGFKLVREVEAAGHRVTALPGPSAVLAALTLSGLPTDRFLFAGFPDARPAARRADLRRLAEVPATLVFFEAPGRVAASLADMATVFGDRPAALARELTKRFEEVRRGRLSELAQGAVADPPRGEIAVVVGPPGADDQTAPDLPTLLGDALARLPFKLAVADVTAATGLPRRVVYAAALAQREVR
jgi:16S rRNA (cytidine1402-2'-O)-methyltransferase